MIVKTIGELIADLKKYPKSAHKEIIGMSWYRRKAFRYDVEKKKFLTNFNFGEALSLVNDDDLDEQLSERIIYQLRDLEECETIYEEGEDE